MSSWTEADLTEAVLDWAPTAEMIASEIAMVTGSIGEQISHNSESAVMMETLVFFVYIMWRAGGLMLVGMALYKWNVLSAGKSKDFYKKGMLIGWLIGFPLIIYGIYTNFKHDWSYEYSMFSGGHFNYWGSLGVSFGYICMIMLMVQSGGFSGLKHRLAAVGQMAFTNYITQSLICTFIFWGWGLGLFGQVERLGQIAIVLAVWLLQLWWSPMWLSKFRFGPLEWLWRSLTYRTKQSMKKP